MDTINLGLREYAVADTSVNVVDIFINGQAFALSLKQAYPEYFSQGRYLELQIPILSGALDNQILNKQLIDALLPAEGVSAITPLYGCYEGCCLQLFVDVDNQGSSIVWRRVGQWLCSVDKPEYDDQHIIWLPHFKPLHFTTTDYIAVNQAFQQERRRFNRGY